MRLFALAVLIAAVYPLWAGDKQYPLAVKVLETDAITSKVDGTRSTTTCSTDPTANEVTCESSRTPDTTHTDLVSVVDVSDGKLYTITCVLGAGGRFLSGSGQAMAASAGLPTVSGCRVPPGTYQARWDKGRLRVLHEKNGKLKETTFVVLSSVAAPTEQVARPGGASTREKTMMKFSSTPVGTEIELDGSFVGQTPSSILVTSGEHTIRISKGGCKEWERKIKASGGEATVAVELEHEP